MLRQQARVIADHPRQAGKIARLAGPLDLPGQLVGVIRALVQVLGELRGGCLHGTQGIRERRVPERALRPPQVRLYTLHALAELLHGLTQLCQLGLQVVHVAVLGLIDGIDGRRDRGLTVLPRLLHGRLPGAQVLGGPAERVPQLGGPRDGLVDVAQHPLVRGLRGDRQCWGHAGLQRVAQVIQPAQLCVEAVGHPVQLVRGGLRAAVRAPEDAVDTVAHRVVAVAGGLEGLAQGRRRVGEGPAQVGQRLVARAGSSARATGAASSAQVEGIHLGTSGVSDALGALRQRDRGLHQGGQRGHGVAALPQLAGYPVDAGFHAVENSLRVPFR